jgi:hypothetical protein
VSNGETFGWRLIKGQSPRASRDSAALKILSGSDEMDPAISIISFSPLNNLGGVLTFVS